MYYHIDDEGIIENSLYTQKNSGFLFKPNYNNGNSMKIYVENSDGLKFKTQVLVVNLFGGSPEMVGPAASIDSAIGGLIKELVVCGEIRGTVDEITVIHTPSFAYPDFKPDRVMIVGSGKTDDFDLERIRKISAQAARKLRSLNVKEASFIVPKTKIKNSYESQKSEAICEGILLGLYKFDKYKSISDRENVGKANRLNLEKIQLLDPDKGCISKLRDGVIKGETVSSAANVARDMVNEPPNVLIPEKMSEIASSLAKQSGLKINILDENDCKNLGMGAYLGVSQGSDNAPKFIHMTYDGDRDHPENNIWLIGKGITFDSGGLSLKSSMGMMAMKGDMGGGAAAIAAITAVASIGPKINVDVICAATENMPGGSAQRPGDVVQSMNGKWIEILNTDAEGRLTLADAISYARSKGAARIVDIATLTGAISVALGRGQIGAFSNDDDLFGMIDNAAKKVGEPIWRMPLDKVSKRQNVSTVADLKNTGGRDAGSITAAHFIAEFVDDIPWIHLDIAARVFSDKEEGINVTGATGIPTRTLIQLVMDLTEQ